MIGYPGTDLFLSVPAEAVRVLTWLREGKPGSEVKRLFLQQYGSELDLEDFTTTMKQHGFLRESPREGSATEAGEKLKSKLPSKSEQSKVLFRSDSFPQWFARAFFSPYKAVLCAVLFTTALSLLWLQPGVIPGYRAFVFEDHVSLYVLGLYVCNFPFVLLHEMGHLLAARRHGIPGSLGFGHRLWIVVSESDISGLWQLPRRKRYLPYLAGPLVDVCTASLFIILLWMWSAPESGFGLAAHRMVSALLMMALLRLYFQCFFFVRTDFYYVLANFFKCKNLLEDTRDFIHNLLKRVLRFGTLTDQSMIPDREMRAIRCYSLIWVTGRVLAFGLLFLILIPVIVNFGGNLFVLLGQGLERGVYPFLDALLLTLIFLATLFLGFGMWGRSMWLRIKRKRSRHE